MKFDHVVIGGSAGAVSAVEAIRNLDKKAAIVVVHDEAALAYSRPLISKLLTGEKDLEGIIFRSGEFWKKYNVQLIHDKAIEIDADDRTLTLARGRRIEFGDLLLAVGGEPITPRIEGSEEQVYTFTTIADVERLSPLLPRFHRVVVVGGGLIGVSLSEALCKIGKKVTVVELKDRILSQALDERASSILESKMQQAGVELLTGRSIASMHWQGERVSKIELDTGETMSCDLVVTAIGVRPNIRLAAEAGVTVNHGIVVDDTMQTNFPEVYACGDAAEIYDFVRKAHRPLARTLWTAPTGCLSRRCGDNLSQQRTPGRPGG